MTPCPECRNPFDGQRCACGYVAQAPKPAEWLISHCVKCSQVAIRHRIDDPDRVCKWCKEGRKLSVGLNA